MDGTLHMDLPYQLQRLPLFGVTVVPVWGGCELETRAATNEKT